MDRETYTVGEAARILKVGEHRVRQMLRDGELEGRRDQISGRWLVDKAVVHIRKQEREARTPTRRPPERREASLSAADWVERVETLQRELGRLEGEFRARAELSEVTESTLRETLERERERADRLEEELREERERGFWARLFGR